MAATIIDGKAIAQAIRDEARRDAADFAARHGRPAGLTFLLVGEHPASQVYVRNKGIACEEVGIAGTTERFPTDFPEAKLLARIAELNRDARIDGILVQLPLPGHIREQRVLEAIDPAKDVDGFHPVNVGRLVLGQEAFVPCTPAGIRELLVRSGVETRGAHVVVVGRSNIVGKPIANLLLQKRVHADAVVTVCHSAAGDVTRFTREADILIAAVGRARMLTADAVKPGAVVIDVGINRIADPSRPSGTRLVGDVDFESVRQVAGMITPVPGGVGPMTIAMLLKNTLRAAELHLGHGPGRDDHS